MVQQQLTDVIVERLQGQILRGETYTLLRNNGARWDVKDAAGRKITAPAVCFMTPPTDPEAVSISDKWVCMNFEKVLIKTTFTEDKLSQY